MGKGSSGLKKKKLRSSKPYDVSNSFVKKVTARVTNLLSQPAWLSKWFTASVDSDSGSEDDDDDDDDTANTHTHARKRAKIQLNQPFPPNSFEVSPIVNDQASSQRASKLIIRGDGADGAVAGPSGISTRQLISSTPNIQSTGTRLLAGAEQKMNGDDRSEGSESTSGCSSLVPQANRQFQAGENAINSLLGRRRSMDEKLNFTGHLQSPRSLLSDRSHSWSQRLNSYANRRKPSFNVSAFGSPLLGKDKSSPKSNVVSSPFYYGRTMYGGASAYRTTKDKSFIHSEAGSHKQCGVQVKPVNCVLDPLSSMGTTARRILEALEQFSTPVLDAKRIPLQPSTPPLSNKRKRPHGIDLQPGQEPHMPKSACGLTIPTVPVLLKMRHREKLQDSLESARCIAVSSNPSNFNHEYKLRLEDDGKKGRHGGKIRGKVKELEEVTVEAVNLPDISLPVTSLPKFDFVVPPAADIPVVTSTFKFASPITVAENTRTCLANEKFTFSKPLSAVGNKDITVDTKINCVDISIPNCPTKLSGVQFISRSDNKVIPHEKGDGIIMSHKNSKDYEMCFGIKPATELTTGSVMDILGKKRNCTDKAELLKVGLPDEKGDAIIMSQKNSKDYEMCFGIKPATELTTGSVMDILGKKRKCTDKAELLEAGSSSIISLDKFKPAPGTWECGACMIRNGSDAVNCAACKTSRTSTASFSSTAAAMPKCTGIQVSASEDVWECSSCHVHNLYSGTVCSRCLVARTEDLSHGKETEQPAVSVYGSGSKLKRASETWECGTCMVRNRNSLKHCHACETRRPVLAAKSTPTSLKSMLELGFGDKFKKPPGSWDCPDCMLQNKSDSLNCVACQRAKPGSESQSAIKFSFGIDKAGVSVKESDSASSSSTQDFQFGETKVIPASEFTFGVTQACETKGPALATKPMLTSSTEFAADISSGDRLKKSSGMWNCSSCMVQNNSDSLKCVACEGARPGSESHSAIKLSFGIDKAGVSVKESDSASSSNMQGFTFGVPKVTSDSMPKTAETCTSTAVSTGFTFGSPTSPSASETVVKPTDTSLFSQTGFCFGIPQLSQFQPPASSKDQKPSGGLSKKRRSSDTDEVTADFKGDGEATTGLNREPVTATHTKQIEEKSEGEGHNAKRVMFSFNGGSFTNEKPNTSTKMVQSAKSGFDFAAIVAGTASTDVNMSLVEPATTVPSTSFTLSQPTFGSSTAAAITASSNMGVAVDTCTAPASDIFPFGSTKSCVTFGGSCSQQSASTSGSTHAFGTALKTVAPSVFTFGSHVSNKETAGATTSSTQVPSFVPITSTATITAFGSLATIATMSPSLSSFASATTAPNFSLGARGTTPVFGTPNTSINTTITTSPSFGSVPAPGFSTGFSSIHEQKPSLPAIEKSTASPTPFTFGSSLGQTAPLPFGSVQNDQGLANKGTFIFGSASTPVANSGFGFVSSNEVQSHVGPAFNFGSNAVTTSSSVIPSLFQAAAPPSGSVFGASSSVFGANNPGSSNPATTTAAVIAGTSTPAFNFGSSSSQPSSNMFNFTANQATGSTNVPVQSFTSPTSNFNFNQPQSAAQPSLQLVAPTFDPSVRPSFNFSKGETPSFTAAAAATAPRPERRIKKAVRRTHPR